MSEATKHSGEEAGESAAAGRANAAGMVTAAAVLESISDGFFMLDAAWRLTYINAAAERLLGGNRAVLLGRNHWEIYPELIGTIAEHEFRRAAGERVAVEFEIFYEPWRRWFAVKAWPSEPAGIFVCFRDIGAAKEAEMLLRENQQRLRAILDASSAYFGLLKADGTMLDTNRASLEFAGTTREEVIGVPFWDTPWFTATPGAPAAVRKGVEKAAAGELARFEITLNRPSGEAWDFDVSCHPVRNARGEVDLIVPEGRNISEQNRDRERLQQQWRMFDTVLSNVTDLLYVYDTEARFTYVNRAVVTHSRRPAEKTIGKTAFELYPPKLAALIHRQIREVVETGEPLRGETSLPGGDGEPRHYEYVYAPVFAADGSVEAVTGSTRDVTERKRAEEQELKRQAHLLETARLESLGVMAGGIAHDFNNLLTGILGNASLLVETAQGGDCSIAGQILFAAERAADLTRQMLAYSGKGHIQTEVFDLNTLIRENLTLLRASLTRCAGIELDLADSCFIEADRVQIQQVVMNLLINASEAQGEHPCRVFVRSAVTERSSARQSEYLHTVAPAGSYVLLEVRDEGVGMTAETLKKIFDPFFTTKFTGRGLGLAAVLGIVKGHRGDIEVESAPGLGATFRILLPASQRPMSPRAPEKAAPDLAAASRTVLVVDDEAIVRNFARLALEQAGFRVVTANDGAEALEALQAGPDISVVVLDLTMPVMSGEQALPLIRAACPKVPVILSSGFSEAEISQRFSSAGIAGVLQKPYRVSAIVSLVAMSLAGRETPQEIPPFDTGASKMLRSIHSPVGTLEAK
jgi:PAS domain S-box-containing protein